MKKTQFDSFEQMADSTAKGFGQAAADYAFQLFRDKQFRSLADFEHLSQTEQDRIFNELVVAFLVLTMLMLEALDLRIAEELRNYLTELNKKIPDAYVGILKELGVDTKYIKDWEKLIRMRYEEYARDRHDVRAAAMEIESSEKRLDLDDLSKIQLLVPVQAVAIGCHHHICRNKTDEKDELFKITLRSLSKFYGQVRLRLEGGKMSPLTWLKVALKKIFHR